MTLFLLFLINLETVIVRHIKLTIQNILLLIFRTKDIILVLKLQVHSYFSNALYISRSLQAPILMICFKLLDSSVFYSGVLFASFVVTRFMQWKEILYLFTCPVFNNFCVIQTQSQIKTSNNNDNDENNILYLCFWVVRVRTFSFIVISFINCIINIHVIGIKKSTQNYPYNFHKHYRPNVKCQISNVKLLW